MYDLGILGGMGSEATETLYRMILSSTETQKDQDFPEMVILNKSSIPDRSAYLLGQSEENPLPVLQEGTRELNLLQVGRIALPCNTAHAFYADIQAVSDCPVINMLESSLEYIWRTRPGARVCILGTLGTVRTKVYEKYNHFSLDIVYPDEAGCEEVHSVIYDIKTGIHENMDALSDRLALVMQKTADAMTWEAPDQVPSAPAAPSGWLSLEPASTEQGSFVPASPGQVSPGKVPAERPVFLLACTELSVLGVERFPQFDVLDAMGILAQVSVAAGSKKLRAGGIYDVQVIEAIARKYV
ncbi:MAG: amino acid racemase [Lachnospiraceae bacterium]|nr:amino acid racemase [Lachnospiraceae bacterium]